MLRIHFTSEDLSSTRIASQPDVLWEVLLSLHTMQRRPDRKEFDLWRRNVRAGLAGTATAATRMLCRLAPHTGYSADFLTPTAGTAHPAEALEIMLATPRRQLRDDIEQLAHQQAPPAWMTALAGGDVAVLRLLGEAVQRFHDIALGPYWRAISEQIDADRAVRIQTLANRGTGQILAELHPLARWQPPVLELPYPVHQDLFLNGRGLVLIPSFFCFAPITLKDTRSGPVLVYPVTRQRGWTGTVATDGGPGPRPLAALLGRTRATVLSQLTQARTTSELARHMDISAASASQHATVLRRAGLIVTHRDGTSVRHTLTSLGAELLVANRDSP